MTKAAKPQSKHTDSLIPPSSSHKIFANVPLSMLKLETDCQKVWFRHHLSSFSYKALD